MKHGRGFLFTVLIVVIVSSTAAFSPINDKLALAQENQTSAEEQNKRLVLDLPNSGLDIEEEIDQFLANDSTIHNEEVEDLQHLKNISKDFLTAFPDMKAEPQVIVAEDDMVGVLWTFKGTHLGEYLGVPATGKPVTLKMAEFMKISNGTISEYWNVPDATDLLIDIGYLVHRNATNTTTTAVQ